MHVFQGKEDLSSDTGVKLGEILSGPEVPSGPPRSQQQPARVVPSRPKDTLSVVVFIPCTRAGKRQAEWLIPFFCFVQPHEMKITSAYLQDIEDAYKKAFLPEMR